MQEPNNNTKSNRKRKNNDETNIKRIPAKEILSKTKKKIIRMIKIIVMRNNVNRVINITKKN